MTAAHWAYAMGHTELGEMLLKINPELEQIQDNQNKMPRSYILPIMEYLPLNEHQSSTHSNSFNPKPTSEFSIEIRRETSGWIQRERKSKLWFP